MKNKTFVVGGLETNCYVVWDERSGEAAIIDPGAVSEAYFELIDREGLALKYVLLTHGHGDHIGGVEEVLLRYPAAVLAASRDEKDLLGDARANYSKLTSNRGVSLEPGILLGDGDEIALGGGALKFKVLATPGHTRGGVSYYVREVDGESGGGYTGTVFTGDTLFRASVGRTDLSGGDTETLMNSIRTKLYVLPDDTLALPGHGPATNIGYEKAANPYVRT